MIKHLLALLIVAAWSISPVASAERVAKVAVLSSGVVLLDGKQTTLQALEEHFKGLKATGGAVWYYRENPRAEPTAQAMAVVQLIIKYQLSVSMSSKRDFSDYIDQDGISRPRPR